MFAVFCGGLFVLCARARVPWLLGILAVLGGMWDRFSEFNFIPGESAHNPNNMSTIYKENGSHVRTHCTHCFIVHVFLQRRKSQKLTGG